MIHMLHNKKSRDKVWNEITKTRYCTNKPDLDDSNFMKSTESLFNSFYRDYSFVTKSTDTIYRKKPFHFHGTCFKFKYVP